MTFMFHKTNKSPQLKIKMCINLYMKDNPPIERG